jgi:hypothetical protein
LKRKTFIIKSRLNKIKSSALFKNKNKNKNKNKKGVAAGN